MNSSQPGQSRLYKIRGRLVLTVVRVVGIQVEVWLRSSLISQQSINGNDKSARIADGARIINMAFANAPVAVAA